MDNILTNVEYYYLTINEMVDVAKIVLLHITSKFKEPFVDISYGTAIVNEQEKIKKLLIIKKIRKENE